MLFRNNYVIHNRTVTAIMLCCSIVLAGCGPSRIVLHPDFDGSDIPAPATAMQGDKIAACLIVVSDVKDARSKMDAISTNSAVMQITAEDMVAWLRNGLASMSSPTFHMSNHGNPDSLPSALFLNISLQKMYLTPVATSKASTVVIDYQILDSRSTMLDQGSLRGSDTSVNWMSSESEINKSFNDSYGRILAQLGGKIVDKCGSQSIANHAQGEIQNP